MKGRGVGYIGVKLRPTFIKSYSQTSEELIGESCDILLKFVDCPSTTTAV